MSCQGAAMLLPGIITVKGVTLTPADLPGIWGSIPVFSLVQFSLSVVSDSLWPHESCQASLSITSSWNSLNLMSIELVMPSNHLILCCSLLPLPLIFPSIRDFSNELILRIRWPKFWSSTISPANEYSGLISFRIDWFDLLALIGENYSKILM